jgi:hypothetical protein
MAKTKEQRNKQRFTTKLSDPDFRGGAEMYGAARARLRKERGRAQDQRCVECGEPADVYVHKPRRNAETYLDPRGTPFGLDARDYAPMCSADAAANRKKRRAKDATR